MRTSIAVGSGAHTTRDHVPLWDRAAPGGASDPQRVCIDPTNDGSIAVGIVVDYGPERAVQQLFVNGDEKVMALRVAGSRTHGRGNRIAALLFPEFFSAHCFLASLLIASSFSNVVVSSCPSAASR